ncbi:MAG: hypothetical protein ACN4GM_17215 [Gammaproteobacteria bacterium]
MKRTQLSTPHHRRLKAKAIKKNIFSEIHKRMLPLLVVSLLYAIISGSLSA